MKIIDLLVPARVTGLFSRLFSFEKKRSEAIGETYYEVPESWLVQVFQELGAVNPGNGDSSESKNVKNENLLDSDIESADNQSKSTSIPLVLVEIMKKHEVNVVRAIMIDKNLSLKEVALKYGGKSAQANVSNFLSRSEEELKGMRRSTIFRLATAIGFQPEKLYKYVTGE